ncbi:membrane protein [Virgisporangium aliadipatigenens]|uniref:Membrane protein n=1 Tax=Virgisporangium aliadipatigenens TaxID=741659 RepID=A0A8J3YK38_9ACTN|nr:ABC transporter permease [Virgisporangium aliadipatigenens]GIJ46636.1 membrane protein [Virgisporangium aliadipatigenens]
MIKATLKSLLARKLRLLLSGLAVVLAVTFISGSFVLTDTLGRSFDKLFETVYENTDIQVTTKPPIEGDAGFALPTSIRSEDIAKVKAVPGVEKATGQIAVNGARVIGRNNKLVPNTTGTRLGANWTGDDEVAKIRDGQAPTSDNEVMLNGQVAKDSGYKIGETVKVKTPADNLIHEFKVVGIVGNSGGRDSIGGEHIVFFTEKAAQEFLLGAPGTYSLIDVRAASGVPLATLQKDLRAALGDQYLVETGAELAKKNAAPLKQIFKFFNYVLLGFGVIALMVGIFLILNTFSIVVAQRTRELALMRAMGAGRGQMVGSVLTEAFIVGLIGSTLGLLAGVGLGALGAWGLAQTVDGLEVAGLAVPPAAIILAFAIGIPVTLIAALMPALKAAFIPPIAAMRDAATADRPLTWITISGAVVTLIGGTFLFLGLNGTGSGTTTLLLVLAGVLVLLVGSALLTPFLCRPVVSVIGRLFSWSVPGKLGRRNSSRNPRRTAITAAAVMIGIALVTGISTIVSSVEASATKAIDKQLAADLVISGEQTSEIPPTIDPADLSRIRNIDGVDRTVAVTYEFFAKAGDKDAFVLAYDDWAAARAVLHLEQESGNIGEIAPGQVVLDKNTAKDANLKVGDTVNLQLPKGAKQMQVVGITKESDVANGWTISMPDAQALFRSAAPISAYLTIDSGASAAAVKKAVDADLRNSPEVTVQTRDEFVDSQLFFFTFLIGAVQVLLMVAIAISVLGVINTLVLSVLERTRELGMLRAIGLRRSQTMRMITVESVVISLFGTLLGLGVGAGLGISVVKALKDQGFSTLAMPWGLMGAYLLAALVIGVGAAVIPAVRAARLNVLNAIAYE